MRAVLALALFSACVADVETTDDGVDNTDGDDTDFSAETAGNPTLLDIGFNGDKGQFAYYDDFFKSPGAITPGPRLCHTYVSWRLGNQAPNAGDPTDPTARVYLDNWLAPRRGIATTR